MAADTRERLVTGAVPSSRAGSADIRSAAPPPHVPRRTCSSIVLASRAEGEPRAHPEPSPNRSTESMAPTRDRRRPAGDGKRAGRDPAGIILSLGRVP